MAETKWCDVAIIGAGPAGLTAAYQLSKNGKRAIVLERNADFVGGISRTESQNDFRFDIGGHRFYSKSAEIVDLWKELLPDPGAFMVRQRRSRIFYRGRFFSYPLKPFEALFGLGLVESARCLLSYSRARLHPIAEPANFEQWVSNEFGARLYGIFFKTYTEKVWGMPCTEISADWAAQRIKGFDLGKAVANALFGSAAGGGAKTLIGHFYYPRRGPGMLWESCAEKVRGMGGEIWLGQRVMGLVLQPEGGWEVHCEGADRQIVKLRARDVVSSAPLRDLAAMVGPGLSPEAAAAAAALSYRDFITVAVMLRKGSVRFEDQWIYIHDPDVLAGRVQNYRAWSPGMVPEAGGDCLGLEYFCFASQEGGLWERSDDELGDLAVAELARLGLAEPKNVLGRRVIRQEKAYPVYDDSYLRNVAVIKNEVSQRYPGLHMVGRNGMHKYNNQDHSMMTALLCVENILQQRIVYDLWRINEDAEYGEVENPGDSAGGLRRVPARAKPT